MKAVAYRTPGSIDREDALQDITLEIPRAEGCDLLVRIAAVSVNPVDTKLRLGVAPEGGDWRVLGFDAAGIVETVGPEVQNFKPGDKVFYAVVRHCVHRLNTHYLPHCFCLLRELRRIIPHSLAMLDKTLAAY